MILVAFVGFVAGFTSALVFVTALEYAYGIDGVMGEVIGR